MSISDNIARVKERMENKRARLGLTYEVRLIAVTKTVDSARVVEAINAGVTEIGENKVQEAREKFPGISAFPSITKRLIGHLQENKINNALDLFDAIDSVDSADLAKKLSARLNTRNKTLPILIEVNTSGEESKSGIEPGQALELASLCADLPNLYLQGFMTVGPLSGDESAVRQAFRTLYQIRERALQTGLKSATTLSMGMSGDFELAIEEGSTMVRVGSLLFGERVY